MLQKALQGCHREISSISHFSMQNKIESFRTIRELNQIHISACRETRQAKIDECLIHIRAEIASCCKDECWWSEANVNIIVKG